MCALVIPVEQHDYKVVISYEEIKKLHEILSPTTDQGLDYDDLINFYADYNFYGKGTALKKVLTGSFAPTRIGLTTKSLGSQKAEYIATLYTERLKTTIEARRKAAKEQKEQQLKKEGISNSGSFNVKLASGSISVGPFKNEELCRQAKISLINWKKEKDERYIHEFQNLSRVSNMDPDYIKFILAKAGWKEPPTFEFE